MAGMDNGSIQIRNFFVISATSVWNLLVDAVGTIRGLMKKIFHTEIAKITKVFKKAGTDNG